LYLLPFTISSTQEIILQFFLYLFYAADMPTTPNTTIATFADDTVLLSNHENHILASEQLQHHLSRLQT